MLYWSIWYRLTFFSRAIHILWHSSGMKGKRNWKIWKSEDKLIEMLVRVRDSVTAPLGHLVSWEWDNVHYVNTDNDRKEERHIFKLSNSENKCSPFVIVSHILWLLNPLDLRSDFPCLYDLRMLHWCKYVSHIFLLFSECAQEDRVLDDVCLSCLLLLMEKALFG